MNSFRFKTQVFSALLLVLICLSFNVSLANEDVIQGYSKSRNHALEYDPRPYISLSAIDGHLRFDNSAHRDSTSAEQDSTGIEFQIGERQTRLFGLEIGFVSLGRYTLNGTFGPSVQPKFFELNALFYLPTGSSNQLHPRVPKFAAYVKTGYARCFEDELEWRGLCDRDYLNLGLGLEYKLHRNVGLRLEAQSYLQDFYTTRLGFVFRGEVVDSLLLFINILTSAIVYTKH